MDKKKNKTSKRKANKEEEIKNSKGKKVKKNSKSVDNKTSKKSSQTIEEKDHNDITLNSKSTKSKQTYPKNKSVLKDSTKAKSDNSNPISKNKESGIPKNQITIYSWNVNGLRAVINKGSLKEFVEKENPDIFCLNETKIDEKNLNKLKLNELYNDSYTSYWNCSEKNGYAGVSVFTKIKPLSITNGIGIEKHDSEGIVCIDKGRVITLEFDNFYLVSVYIPNAGQGLTRLKYRTEEWDLDFKDYLETLRKKKNVILSGDLNVAHQEIDLKNPKGNKKTAGFTLEERKGFSNLLEAGWIDTFRNLYPEKVQYSFWSARTNARESNNGWRLDYFIVNKESMENIVDSEILDSIMGSDHCPIKLKYKI